MVSHYDQGSLPCCWQDLQRLTIRQLLWCSTVPTVVLILGMSFLRPEAELSSLLIVEHRLNRLAQLLLRQVPKMMFPRLHYTAEHAHFLGWKYCRGTIATPWNFNDSTCEVLTPTQLHAHTQTKVKLGTARETKTSIVVYETVHASMQYPKWSTEAGTSDHNSVLWALSTLFMDGLTLQWETCYEVWSYSVRRQGYPANCSRGMCTYCR